MTGSSIGRAADLHLHSTCSDGTLSVRAVVDLAAEIGLETIALTDHDTVEGVEEAAAHADALGVGFVTGVEVSSRDASGREWHVLAYGIDPQDRRLGECLAEIREARRERLGRMLRALASVRVRIDASAVLAEARGASVGRPHVADALVRAGYVRDRQQAFDRWLGDGRVAAVPKAAVASGEVIETIHEAGGLAVLAHPARGWDPAAVDRLVEEGLDGLEVVHPSVPGSQAEWLRAAARARGLLESGGSDNHGDEAGVAAMRARRVPAEMVAPLLRRVRNRGRSARAGACT